MYDSHMHSIHSGDSKMSIDEICEIAIEKGLKGITVTEHVSIRRYKKGEDYTRHILNSFADCKEAAEKYKGVLEVRHGMELGEYTTNPDIANDFLNIPDIDLVLGSLHAVRYLHYGNMPVIQIMKQEDFKAEQIEEFLGEYYNQLLEIAKVADIDVLAHLTYPLRYACRIFGVSTLPENAFPIICEILKTAVERGIGIEVNTRSIGKDHNEFVPNEKILAEYKRLGGKLLTLGGDAHSKSEIGNAFAEAKEMLRSLGFESYYYYDKRKPVEVKL